MGKLFWMTIALFILVKQSLGEWESQILAPQPTDTFLEWLSLLGFASGRVIFKSVGHLLIIWTLTAVGEQILSAPKEIRQAPSKFAQLLKGWTWLNLAESAAVGVAVIGSFLLLTQTFPVLRTSLLDVATETFAERKQQETPPAIDAETSRVITIVFSIVFFLFFLSIFPVLARAAETEEKIFRKGITTWRQAVWRNLLFGFIHPLGLPILPISMGVPLSLVGLWFTYHYWKGGLEKSTRMHILYNLCVLPVPCIVIISWWIW